MSEKTDKQIFIINFKTYKQGDDVLKLAKVAQKVSKEIIVGVPAVNVKEVATKVKMQVYAEHVDPFEPGRNTGFIIPEAVMAAGAVGTFLNHSEHKLKFDVVKKTVERCKAIGLKTAVFASTPREAKKIEALQPDFLIYEPPELVAGTISVSTAKPGVIKKISEKVKMPFLVGAGIKTHEDVKLASELGSSGIAVASGITKSDNPEAAIRELML